MGPRPDGRGKGPMPAMRGAGRVRQWGRGQTAAESNHPAMYPLAIPSVNGAAARRPRKVWPR